jgi:hypothetical protein
MWFNWKLGITERLGKFNTHKGYDAMHKFILVLVFGGTS